jgi:hypothetical protein
MPVKGFFALRFKHSFSKSVSRAVWIEAQVPRMPPTDVNEELWPSAVFARSSRGLHDALLRQWKRGSAGVFEVVGASDEAFSCSF